MKETKRYRALWRILVGAALLMCLGASAVFLFSSLILHGPAKDLGNDPRYGEIWKKSQILRNTPSDGIAPIEFSVGGVQYKVPRNYIIHMNNYKGGPQDLVTFKVTYPGFQPLTEATQQCLTQPRAYWPSGCVPIEFWIGGFGDLKLSDDDHFNNTKKWFHSQLPKQGPAGFEMYETGPEDARIETYRKITILHTLVFSCLVNKGRSNAVCMNYASPLPNGNGLSYILDIAQLPDAEAIDNGMRDFIAKATVKGVRE